MRSGKQILRVLRRMKKEAVIVYSLYKNGVCICWHVGKSPVPHIVGCLESVLWGQTLTDQILHHGIAVTECQRCGQELRRSRQRTGTFLPPAFAPPSLQQMGRKYMNKTKVTRYGIAHQ